MNLVLFRFSCNKFMIMVPDFYKIPGIKFLAWSDGKSQYERSSIISFHGKVLTGHIRQPAGL